MKYCVPFTQIRMTDVDRVGGKNASLGEMLGALLPVGIKVPEGFAVTVEAYRAFLSANRLEVRLQEELRALDVRTLENLNAVSSSLRELILASPIPQPVLQDLYAAYGSLHSEDGDACVAVRSSATCEDLPNASFAGQHDSFLDIVGIEALQDALRRCYASVFNARAIKYRLDMGVDHLAMGLSVGVQRMVRVSSGSAGVAFTIEPESGSGNVVYLTSTWGSCEQIVQGTVTPDEFLLFKGALRQHKDAILRRRPGSIVREAVSSRLPRLSIPDEVAEELGRWCCAIEDHYHVPMDVEWAQDGVSKELFIVQARPETVRSREATIVEHRFHVAHHAPPILHGIAVGKGMTSGRVRIISSLEDASRVMQGDIIVAEATNPDWNTMLRKASCIVTDRGGRTSHASIVARELGIHAVVGSVSATTQLRDDQLITVACPGGDRGEVFDGAINWTEERIDISELPTTRTKPMLILADPDLAFRHARLPAAGVGLMRMEFAIANNVRIHPMAVVHPTAVSDRAEQEEIDRLTAGYDDKRLYVIDRLVEAIGLTAAAFYPRPVIVRCSDFKTNEYARLVGGRAFEPSEENPMLGFRGAARYHDERYRAGFLMECEALRRVRNDMGLTNIIVMIPFCRTIDEARKVLDVMELGGLQRGMNGLQVYVMAEIPSNVILAQQFAGLFDGFSIGSNDLTQLVLGVDRDSEILGSLFDERDPAMLSILSDMISRAKLSGRPIGLCGQAPSDHPDVAAFLVQHHIDSISFTPDAFVEGVRNIAAAETNLVSSNHK